MKIDPNKEILLTYCLHYESRVTITIKSLDEKLKTEYGWTARDLLELLINLEHGGCRFKLGNEEVHARWKRKYDCPNEWEELIKKHSL